MFGGGNTELFYFLQAVKTRYEYDMQYTMRRFNVQEAEIVTGVSAHNEERRRSREQAHLHVSGLLATGILCLTHQEALEVVYQGHVQAARDNALDIARKIPGMPTDIPLERYIAWHAYMLTFEDSVVRQWDKEVNQAVWGGVPADEDLPKELRVL